MANIAETLTGKEKSVNREVEKCAKKSKRCKIMYKKC
jgi:hypothetical protein